MSVKKPSRRDRRTVAAARGAVRRQHENPGRDRWQVEPLEIQWVSSSFFDDPSLFPNGTIQFDCALLMQNIEHEWRVLPRLERK